MKTLQDNRNYKKLSIRLPRDALLRIHKPFVRPNLDYGDIIFDKPNNESFKSTAISGAIQGTSREGIPEFLDSGRNSWTLDSRRWILDARLWLWTLDSGRWTLDTGLWMLDSRRWTLDADSGHWTLDTGLWTPDSGRWILDAGLWTQFLILFD